MINLFSFTLTTLSSRMAKMYAPVKKREWKSKEELVIEIEGGMSSKKRIETQVRCEKEKREKATKKDVR